MQVEIQKIESQLNIIEQAITSGELDSALQLIKELQLSLECFFSSPEGIPKVVYSQLNDIQKKLILFTDTLVDRQAETKSQLKKIIKNKKHVGIYNQIK
ncbi:hypothetical protein NQT69_04920 [Pseudoalteromonas shioyasakiensis]|uniref:hypothetical protein n=1 Tax=Pseudoalteromonas shioyasakiensis TaxID=1190813 RepID=UPI002119B121|nr:hypothetical protein [Pseudoalteromonas shioyasakiensis]MCQ8877378.1 hypothetical protein [Pseudoalteromonas shioyasakiensis]